MGFIGEVVERVKCSFYNGDTDLMIWFNPHPGHVTASLDTTLYDDYLCLVTLNQGLQYGTELRYAWILEKNTVRNYVRYFLVHYDTKIWYYFSGPYSFRT